MKAKKLQDAIGMIGDDLIEDAKDINSKPKHSPLKWIASVAAILAIVITANFVFDTPPISLQAYALAEAKYPEMAQYPNAEDYEYDWDTYSQLREKWRDEIKEIRTQYYGYGEGLDTFFKDSAKEFLSNSKDGNKVYSPLNIYMALCMVAETTDANSRKQILDLFGVENIDSLRKQANAVWNANYREDGSVTSILANSIWLNESVEFKQNTLNSLAENYFASSFKGKMGTDDYNKALQAWLNEQTGGLLEEQVEKVEMPVNTLLALASTVYFKAQWQDEFLERNTAEETFHTPNGDVICDFMKQGYVRDYYWGEKFSAVKQELRNSGGMWFILPDEGVSVDDLLLDAEAMNFMVSDGDWENKKRLVVNLSVPKFDVVAETELTDGLKNLGVTDVFNPEISNFSPLTDNYEGIAISKAQHAARVMIDEEGCTAAAFTVILDAGSAMPPADEIDFTLDRPFIFAITSDDGLPLFIGIVNQPI